jgi:hypothetical protein
MSKEFKYTTYEAGGQRANRGKLPMHLIPPEALESLAEVLRYGASKYDDRNWERGFPMMEACYACCQRHLLAWSKGIDLDDESGLHHIDHALTNLAMLVTFIRRNRTDLDDRPNLENKNG